jgi:hypothetical protein
MGECNAAIQSKGGLPVIGGGQGCHALRLTFLKTFTSLKVKCF